MSPLISDNVQFQELLEANLDTEAGPDIADPNSFSEGEFRLVRIVIYRIVL